MQMTNRKNRHNAFEHLRLSSALTRSAAVALSAVAASHPAYAVGALETPTGGSVVAGSALISSGGAGVLNINQSTDRTVINWNSFNIGVDATTQFFQPSNTSLAVNRVTGASTDPTKILGTLKANGRVMVLDGNGVIFGANSRVDVGGIIASTGNVDDATIMSGANRFDLTGIDTGGSVINRGEITVAEGGLAALVAPTVVNNGIINARLGKVVLAAGTQVTVDLAGDQLFEITSPTIASALSVDQKGTINAESGLIQLSAGKAAALVDSVVNMSGVTNASSATMSGGRIVLTAGRAVVKGTMDVRGKAGETSGGVIDVKTRGDATFKDDASLMTNAGGDIIVRSKQGDIRLKGTRSADLSSTMDADGGNIYLIASDGQIQITDGHSIDAAGGELIVDSGDALLAEARSIRNSGTGTIWINQNNAQDPVDPALAHLNTIQAAIDAIENTGSGQNKVDMWWGVWNEHINANRRDGLTNLYLWSDEADLTGSITASDLDSFTVEGFDIHNGNYMPNAITSNNNRIVTILNNVISNFFGDGVHVEDGANITITGNTITDTGDDGIAVLGDANLLISDNEINRAGAYDGYFGYVYDAEGQGADGIYVQDIASDGETFTTRILNNRIDQTMDDGIEVVNSGLTLIKGNVLTDIGTLLLGKTTIPNNMWYAAYYLNNHGADAISVRDIDGTVPETDTPIDEISLKVAAYIESPSSEEDGFALAILDNTIDTALDDGIDVDGVAGRVLIAHNDIFAAGGGLGDYGVDPSLPFYTLGDYTGGDAIHVHNVVSISDSYGWSDYSPSVTALPDSEGNVDTSSYGLVVLDNSIFGTQDDGIDITETNQRVLVANNDISGVGFSNPYSPYGSYYGGYYGGYYGARVNTYVPYGWWVPSDYTGADGIHIDTVYNGAYGSSEFGVVVANNTVALTGDDGIEVARTYTPVLIDGNRIGGAGELSTLFASPVDVYKVYEGYYGPSEDDGPNGISVHNVNANRGYYGYFSGGDGYGFTYFRQNDIVVSNNDIAPIDVAYGEDLFSYGSDYGSVGDGIDIRGNWGNNILVDANQINTTGLNGILVESGYGRSKEREMAPSLVKMPIKTKMGSLTVVITNNTIESAETNGIDTYNIETLEIADNDITNIPLFGSGVYVRGAYNGDVSVHGNRVTNADIGMTFESGLIDLTGDTNTLTGGSIGYRFNPMPIFPDFYGPSVFSMVMDEEPYPSEPPVFPDMSYSFLRLVNDTIGTTSFSGQTQYFVELLGNALFEPGAPTLENGLDATYATPFGVVTPASTGGIVSASVYNYLQEMFWHYPDDNNVGLFFFGTVAETTGTYRSADVYNDTFTPYTPAAGGAGFTITGLPRLPGGAPGAGAGAGGGNIANALNQITPAAGGDGNTDGTEPTPEQLAANEPAAGGDDAACWSDAVNSAGQGRVANYNFSTSPGDALKDTVTCGNNPQ